MCNDCLSGENTVAGLFKIIGFFVVIDIWVYFVDSGQRMKNTHIGFGILLHAVSQNVNVFNF